MAAWVAGDRPWSFLSVPRPKVGQMPGPSIAAPDGRPITDLTREELLALIEGQQVGIRILFPGKDVARQLARRVRPRVRRTIAKYSVGDPEEQARNIVIDGDNLQALVSLYRYRGQVDLVLADPPYNTGNDWRYNDRWDTDPNDPGLGDWVGPDDVGRHTKWMKFMYPRLQMMRAMLKPTGVLAICIDHRELFRLGQMLDELFGEANRIAIINWQKSASRRNDQHHVSSATEYVLVYAKDKHRAQTGLLDRPEELDAGYLNHDGDPNGRWLGVSPWGPSRATHMGMVYGVQNPFTGRLHYPPGSRCWGFEKATIKIWLEGWGSQYEERELHDGFVPALLLKGAEDPRTLTDPLDDPVVLRARTEAESVRDTRVWPDLFFTKNGLGKPRKKTYIEKVKKGIVPDTFWADDDHFLPLVLGSTSWEAPQSGTSEVGARELGAIVGADHGFETVKPLRLFSKIIQLWCPADGLVLDPFAGSGTAGHAVLAVNHNAGTTRRFILVEQGRPDRGDSYARTLIADRLRRVISGNWANGKGAPVPGGFRFVQLQKKVDAHTVLRMERDEMLDTVIASHYDSSRRRGPSLVSLSEDGHRYLIAKNADDEGFFLIWDGPDKNTDFTEDVYEAVADEAKTAGLTRAYHVYARLYVFQTENVRFYQIPDQILADFGLNLNSEPFHEDLA